MTIARFLRLTSYLPIVLCILATATLQAEPSKTTGPIERTENNGQLILQDIPAIPADIIDDLNQYQNVRSAGFASWDRTGKSLFVRTRFGDVSQLHQVRMPGGARQQITFFDEPLGSVTREPNSDRFAFTMDAGGSEFSQIFILEPTNGKSLMLTDGISRNGSVLWARNGSQFAYASTQRNGASNDVWTMDVDDPEARELIFESPDGTYWAPQDYSKDNQKLLIANYRSIADSTIHLLDRTTGATQLLQGFDEKAGLEASQDGRSSNYAIGFDSEDNGYFFVSNQGSEFTRLGWASLTNPEQVTWISSGINWDVEDMVLSLDRRRAAFVVNAGGISELFLLDTSSQKFQRVESMPIGLVGNMAFRPDGLTLALTLNTAKTPSDTFVLSLDKNPLKHHGLERWTYSEIGGLNSNEFIEPQLIEFSTFDKRKIPAFYYKPRGKGPFPVVISIHGGPEGQALPTFSSTYQMWLQKLGIAVLVPNVRGSAGYGKSYLELDNGFRREDSVKDIGHLLDFIKSSKDLDENRVAVFGGSYGGYMVLASAVHYSDRLRAAVDIVGISNFVTFLENTQDYRRDLRRAEYGDEREPLMRAHLQAISPLNRVDKINIPMLVVQGENDPRVPVSEATQMVAALRSNGTTVWYMNALNEGHGYRKKENRDVYQQATVLFLKQHLLE